MKIRDLKVLDVFRFADDRLNAKRFGNSCTYFMDDITGYDHNYTTYNTINARGQITGLGKYRCDNPEVILLGNAREMYPKRFAGWYDWR